LLQVSSETGSVFDRNVVEKDIKDIYRTGFFDQVTAILRSSSRGPELVFQVVERPAIREILIEGNDEVSKDTIREKLDISARKFLDRRKLEAGITELKSYYQAQGFYGTTVDFEVKKVQENQVDVLFRVNEGLEKVIRKVRIVGTSQLDEDDIVDAIETSRYRWWSSWATGSGVVREEQLKTDVQRIMREYLTKGFVDVNVTEPEVSETDDGLEVTFKVKEGEKFDFGEISASGDLFENSEAKTLEDIKAKPGETFNVELLRQDTFTVSGRYTDIGYAFVNVDPVTTVNRESKKVRVNFTVDRGQLITIDRIIISGNEKTRDNVIRRSLKINEQELFSSSKIERSQTLLQRLGYFDEVTITPEPSLRKDEVNLSVAVREGQTGTFTAGAGISSGDGFIVSSRIAENNLFGSGNSVALDVNTGSRRENYVLSFDNPRYNDTNWSLGLDLLKVRREFDDFDREQTGGTVTVGYPLWFLGPEYLDDVRFSLSYELLSIDISDVDDSAPALILREEGQSTSSSITPRLVRNTVDNPLNPTSGSRQSARVEFAGLGGDEEFWLLQLANTWYYPLWDSPIGEFVFSQRTNFGYGDSYNNEDFPLFRRFFPGGINSVRGFESRDLGPKDSEGNEFGGSKQLVGNFELIFPLFATLGLNGVAFYDIGNAFDDTENIEFSELREAVGWGIRWRSPIAPIRIEFGYPLDKQDGEKSVVTHFSFGSPL
jgi:outer membrane protein insertion porin family